MGDKQNVTDSMTDRHAALYIDVFFQYRHIATVMSNRAVPDMIVLSNMSLGQIINNISISEENEIIG